VIFTNRQLASKFLIAASTNWLSDIPLEIAIITARLWISGDILTLKLPL
jgi:hypothetical protein